MTLLKCSERVCGIVEGGSIHKKQRGGEGEGWGMGGGGRGLSGLREGSKPGLETVQGLGCHYFLGQAVPFRSGRRMTYVCTLYCTT